MKFLVIFIQGRSTSITLHILEMEVLALVTPVFISESVFPVQCFLAGML